MSSELEQQLRRALARVEPDTTATEQAKAAALAAVSSPSGLRSRYRLALIAAALVGALVVTGVTLAASRTAREVVGIADGPAKTPLPQGPLPPGSGGFAAYGGGRLWLASPSLTVAGKPLLSGGALARRPQRRRRRWPRSGRATALRRWRGLEPSHRRPCRGGRLGADRHRDCVRRQVAPGSSAAHDRGRRRSRPPRRKFGVRGDAVMAGGLVGALLTCLHAGRWPYVIWLAKPAR